MLLKLWATIIPNDKIHRGLLSASKGLRILDFEDQLLIDCIYLPRILMQDILIVSCCKLARVIIISLVLRR
jgi:hypothetical protein